MMMIIITIISIIITITITGTSPTRRVSATPRGTAPSDAQT